MSSWNENDHPRDDDGKFTDKGGDSSYRERVNAQIKWAAENGVDLPLHSDGTLDTIRLEEKASNALEPKQYTDTSSVTNKEWFLFYQAVGEKKRGMYYPQTRDGYVVQIGAKLFYAKGTYEKPKVSRIREFESKDDANLYFERKYKNG